MVNLIALNTIEIDEYNSIAGSKANHRRANLLAMAIRVGADYVNYRSNFATIHQRGNSNYTNQTEKEDLLHCYNGSTVALESLIKRIRENQTAVLQGICGFCLCNNLSETDHYIPKEEYPEFSVLASNLVPICSICNKKKLHHWRTNGNTNRLFIHLYKDTLPNIQFLNCTVSFVNGLPQLDWSLSNPNNSIPARLFEIITSHFSRLDLAVRYREATNELLSDIDTTVKASKETFGALNANQIESLLKSTAQQEILKYGINYWKGIAKMELAGNSVYINSLL